MMTAFEFIVMITIALALDAVGVILFILSFIGIGIPLSWLTDAIGGLAIGGWIFLRSGGQPMGKRLVKTGKRAGLTLLGEVIPFLGDIMPFWTISVLFEILTGKKSEKKAIPGTSKATVTSTYKTREQLEAEHPEMKEKRLRGEEKQREMREKRQAETETQQTPQ